jgi:hypothetical protein
MIDDITALADQAARKAQDRWDAAQPCIDHPALNRLPPGDLRQEGDNLLMPLWNLAGEIRALEITTADGGKYPWPKGCQTRGCFFLLGEQTETGPICICRGWSSGVAIRATTGHPVHITLGETGLPSVSKALRAAYPDRKIIIFGDTDPQADGTDKCRDTALRAAQAVSGVAVFPTLPGKSDFWEEWNEKGAASILSLLKKAEAPAINSHQFRFISAGELVSRPADWLIRGYLETDSVAGIFGPPACLKTFLALDMGLCISAGVPWHGHQVKQGPVPYICGEGKSGIKKRITAWERHHGREVFCLYRPGPTA